MNNHVDKKKFSIIEKRLSLFERNYNGFYYWQYIRFYVCESLFGNRVSLQKIEQQKTKGILSILSEIVFALFCYIKEKVFFVKKKDYDVVFFRDVDSNDKFFDSWKWPDSLRILNLRLVRQGKKIDRNVHYFEFPRIQMKIKQELFKRFNLYRFNVDKSERAFLKKLEKILLKEFGQVISATEMERAIRDQIIEDHYYRRYYKWFFEKINCNYIAVVCYYQSYYFSAYRIARQKGIKVIEFQHGVINNHEEYWFEDNRGLYNYTPDILLTFGDIHNCWINLVRNKKAVSIGYPFQEKCINNLKQIETDDKLIVIYPESDIRFENLINDFVNIIVLKGYKVIMKLHPLQADNVQLYYPILSHNKNIRIVTKDNQNGIYYWIKKAKHHIMASTTVGLEAVVFDHSNICIDTEIPHDQTQCLIDWKLARGFSSTEELVEHILNPISLCDERIKYRRTQLWKENAGENMTRFFNDLKRV